MKKTHLIVVLCLFWAFSGLACGQRDPGGTNNLRKQADSEKFDRIIGAFMKRHKIPGLSIAFSKDGKLLFARGYGFADRATKEKVTTAHRFRIASISKPITSVSILRLVEEGRLSLDSKVFGKDGIFKGKYLKQNSNKNVELIEVKHLLKHTSAPEWANRGNDPMFLYADLGHDDLIRRILAERSIKNVPGTTYAYSNFGYCILGRVIEKVSGQPYSAFVKNEVFSSFNGGSFEMGKLRKSQKAYREAREVNYYPKNGTWEHFNMPFSRMDSHGGWISNAIDLVKFAQKVDGFNSPPDILASNTLITMKTGSKVNKGYAMGWTVNSKKNSWHGGALPGTSSILVNTSSGMSWSILTNSRGTSEDYFTDLDQLMWKIIAEMEL